MVINKVFELHKDGSVYSEMSGYAAASQKAHSLLASYPESTIQVVITFNATPLKTSEKQLELDFKGD